MYQATYKNSSSLVIGFLACLDSLLYGRWTLVPFNFLMFNFFSNAAQFYGHHVWHWYLSYALPSILGPIVLPILVSPIYIFRTKKRSLLLALSASCLSYIIFHRYILLTSPYFMPDKFVISVWWHTKKFDFYLRSYQC